MNLLNKLKIKAIKHEKSMSDLIRHSGVSRDTFYKRLKRGDQEFYKQMLKELNN